MKIHALRPVVAAVITLLAVVAVASPSPPPAAGEHGMVVTAHELATKVGVDVLEKGGNAVDAAIAVGYTLAVTYPAAGNLGGGGFMTLQLADGRKTFLDFREKAPLAATERMFQDRQGKVVPELSTRGHLAVGVPGTVSGLEYARVKYGTMPREALIAPAIELAEKGFVLSAGDVELLVYGTEGFRKDPATAAIFLDRGQPFRAGSRLVQKDLARTLGSISRLGADGFYKGPVAAALVASSKAGGGIITQADLDRYATRELAPLECDYRQFHIVTAPPPSGGGIALCEMLNILEGYSLKEMGRDSSQAVHYQIEAMRYAYADRNALLGDPDFVKNPVERLIDDAHAAQIRRSIDPKRAGSSLAIRPGSATREGTNTTHYSIADDKGNAVAVTYTLNDWFGAHVTVAGAGFLLNNEMDDFTAKQGAPNMYGLVQGEPNRIQPGKRPLSSMTPTIVTRDGKPLMLLGTPGGSRITTAVLLTMLNVLDYGMDIQEAVDAPRFHQQWLPAITLVEDGALSSHTRTELERMGHEFGLPQPENHVAAILIGAPALHAKPVGANRFYGGLDRRRDTGLALGY